MEKKCEVGKTEFVDEDDVGKGVVLNKPLNKEKLKIVNNQYQCKGKSMKGDIYGTK